MSVMALPHWLGNEMLLVVQELLVLGRQRLTALRDAITCPADRNLGSLGTAVRGAFFYIEGVFYVDMRGSAAEVDYVAPIREFCRSRGIPPPPPVPQAAKAMPRAALDPGDPPPPPTHMPIVHDTALLQSGRVSL